MQGRRIVQRNFRLSDVKQPLSCSEEPPQWKLSDGVFNNWSVIQTAALKLVTTFSCHGEYQMGLCLCVREKHKSDIPAIKAARLETRECAGYIFLSLLSTLLTLLFRPFSLPSFQFISPCYLPKGKMDSLPLWYQPATQVSLCPSVL